MSDFLTDALPNPPPLPDGAAAIDLSALPLLSNRQGHLPFPPPSFSADQPVASTSQSTGDGQDAEEEEEAAEEEEDTHPGYPSLGAFEAQREEYLGSLDQKKKRGKALVDNSLYAFVKTTLLRPQDTTLRSAQDRFWARATFTLAKKGDDTNAASASAAAKVLTSLSAALSGSPSDSPDLPLDMPIAATSTKPPPKGSTKAKNKAARRPGRPAVATPAALLNPDGTPIDESLVVIVHDGLPVATSEQIYDLLIEAHEKVQHGGREKTFKEIRGKWSWVPKELVARFVKVCPTCSANSTPGVKWRNKPAAGVKGPKTSPAAKRARRGQRAKGKGAAVRGKGKGKVRAQDDDDDEEDDGEDGEQDFEGGGERDGKDEVNYISEDAEGESVEEDDEDEFRPVSANGQAGPQSADRQAEDPPSNTRASGRQTRTSTRAAAATQNGDTSADLSIVSAASLLDSPSKAKPASAETSPEAPPRRRGPARTTPAVQQAQLFQPATSPAAPPVPVPLTSALPPPPPPSRRSANANGRPSSSSSASTAPYLPPPIPQQQQPSSLYTPYTPFHASGYAHPSFNNQQHPLFHSQPQQHPLYATAYPPTSALPLPYGQSQPQPQPVYRPYPYPLPLPYSAPSAAPSIPISQGPADSNDFMAILRVARHTQQSQQAQQTQQQYLHGSNNPFTATLPLPLPIPPTSSPASFSLPIPPPLPSGSATRQTQSSAANAAPANSNKRPFEDLLPLPLPPGLTLPAANLASVPTTLPPPDLSSSSTSPVGPSNGLVPPSLAEPAREGGPVHKKQRVEENPHLGSGNGTGPIGEAVAAVAAAAALSGSAGLGLSGSQGVKEEMGGKEAGVGEVATV
ncbi:hypothetical protein JCM11641_002348 [Rhodosporidiobolus odoratus]